MLKSRVSQCPVSTAKRSTSASRMQLDHAPVPLTDHAQMLKLRDSEVNAVQYHATVPSAPAYVATQVFAEMATPTSEQETQGTTSNFCSGQLNPIQMSCVSNLNEQNLDEMPQPYGFHSLDRHSVFLADGTEHSYYALPESYPCEQAILAPVFDVYDDESNGRSNEFVQVFAGTPEQQTNSVEKQASHPAPDCFSKPTFCPERPTVGVFNLGNELNPDNEPTAMCVNKASANAFSQDATDFTSILVPCLIVDGPIKCNVRNLKTELHSLPVSALCYTHGKPKQCNMQTSEQGREVWDPGATDLPIRFTTGAGATNQQGTDAYRSARQHIPADTHDKEQMTQERLTSTYFSKAAEIGQTSACLSYNSEILDCTLEQQHQVNEKASVNAQQLRAPPWNVLVIDETRTGWHPGDHTIRLLFYSQGYVVAKRETVQWDPGIGTHSSMYFWLPGLTARIVTRKPLSWLQNSELATWQSLMTSASSVWDPGVHIYLYSWLNILLVWAAADKQLSCTHISDLASWRNQLVCNAASSIWDPGIDSLMFVYICLHLYMTQLGGSSATHACYLPSALLPHIHIVSYGSSNSSWWNGLITVRENAIGQPKCEDEICDLEKLNGGENLSLETQYVEPILKYFSHCRACHEESQGNEDLLWEKSVCRPTTWHSLSFFPWDPGTSASLHSSKGNFCWHQRRKVQWYSSLADHLQSSLLLSKGESF